MAVQQIVEDGQIVDEFNDDLEEETGNNDTQEQPPKPPDVVLPDALSSEEEQSAENASPVEVSEAVSTTAPLLQKEDTTDFDLSDVSIQILLERADGDPRGRKVSVLIHNFSGDNPVIRDFREDELTDTSRLDSIQRAIFPAMQVFLYELAERKQRKLAEAAKRTAKATTHKSVTSTGTVVKPSVSTPDSPFTQNPSSPSPAVQPPIPKRQEESTGKKSTAAKQTKPQPLTLF